MDLFTISISIFTLCSIYASFQYGMFIGFIRGRKAMKIVLELIQEELPMEDKIIFNKAIKSAAIKYLGEKNG